MKEAKCAKIEVVFTVKDQPTEEVRLTGVSPDVLSRPEQIRKVMELLGMPEGTVARVLHTTEDVIVR